MKVSDFDYSLPPGAIAQEPCRRRDGSRLMVVGRAGTDVEHRRFGELPEILRAGDLLVINDTRVIPARLSGTKPTGGKVEVLLLQPSPGGSYAVEWECLINASRNPATGTVLTLGGSLKGTVLGREGETWTISLQDDSGDPMAGVRRNGTMPLPPYIKRNEDDPRADSDRERYQTVYAREEGAVAAPTAGLHFTTELLRQVEERGVRTALVTLHVGIGTFQPVRVDTVEEHLMHSERYDLPEETAEAIAGSRRDGGRVVAVGTTVVRTLEGCADGSGGVVPGSGRCSLFIRPGYRFSIVDAMVTNFHLPRSTLLMLVSAFIGRERILDAYTLALEAGYRFYSYGDAMFLRP